MKSRVDGGDDGVYNVGGGFRVVVTTVMVL